MVDTIKLSIVRRYLEEKAYDCYFILGDLILVTTRQ